MRKAASVVSADLASLKTRAEAVLAAMTSASTEICDTFSSRRLYTALSSMSANKRSTAIPDDSSSATFSLDLSGRLRKR